MHQSITHAAAQDGAGAALLSRLVVARALRAGLLAALDLLPPRPFLAGRHKARAATSAVAARFRLIALYRAGDAQARMAG